MISETSDKKRRAKRDRLVALLGKGMTLEEASSSVGVSSRMVRYWRDADPDLNEAVLDAMAKIDDQVEAVTYRNCLDPDPANNTLRMFWLKSRRPDVYRDVSKQIIDDARKEYDVSNPPDAL